MVNKKGSKHFNVGDIHKNNQGYEFEIVDYKNAHNVTIKWSCGTTQVVSSGNLVKGRVRYNNHPSVFGVGYLGYGRFVPAEYRLGEGQLRIPRYLYRHWSHLLERTTEGLRDIKRYEDACICEEWLNLQNFLEWSVRQIGYDGVEDNGRNWCIDKDILIQGNKLYSPNTCVFVPNEINVFFCKPSDNCNGFTGVSEIDTTHKSPNAKIGYTARAHIGNTRKYLGFFKTPQEAYKAYRECKIESALQLANKWKDKVDERVILSLLNFSDRLPDLT